MNANKKRMKLKLEFTSWGYIMCFILIKEGVSHRKREGLSYLHILVEQHNKDETEDACR